MSVLLISDPMWSDKDELFIYYLSWNDHRHPSDLVVSRWFLQIQMIQYQWSFQINRVNLRQVHILSCLRHQELLWTSSLHRSTRAATGIKDCWKLVETQLSEYNADLVDMSVSTCWSQGCRSTTDTMIVVRRIILTSEHLKRRQVQILS